MTNLISKMFCYCGDCFTCDNQEEDSFENLLDELQPLIELRDNLNMQNLSEEGKSEPGENEFSFESRRLKLGMMSFWDRKVSKYSFDFERKYAPFDMKKFKKKSFQFARALKKQWGGLFFSNLLFCGIIFAKPKKALKLLFC